MCVRVSTKARDTGSPGAGVTSDCEPPGVGAGNSSLLEQCVLSMTEP